MKGLKQEELLQFVSKRFPEYLKALMVLGSLMEEVQRLLGEEPEEHRLRLREIQ